MPLLGEAAVVIWCDMDPAYLTEHDNWHSSEHLPERMAVPGFLRGRRCAASDPVAPQPRFVLYELGNIAVSSSPPYLERLNNPTHWSKRVMAHCRLSRTLCRVAASFGEGLGAGLLTIRCSPQPGREKDLQDWLAEKVLPGLPGKGGIVGAHLLQRDASAAKPLTNEERVRKGGADASADWVVLVEGFDAESVRICVSEAELSSHGAAAGSLYAVYSISHVMISRNA